jgi:hypothetical protein
MAEGTPRTMEFTRTYPPLDQTAADKQRDVEWQNTLRETQEREQAPEIPGRTGEQTQPNPLVEGVTAAFKAVGAGAQNTMQGLTELLLPKEGTEVAKQTPGEFLDSKVQATRQTIIDGLVQIGAAPFIGMGAAAAQELENNWPELAKTQALDSGAAFTLRHIMSGAPAMNAMTQEQIQAMRQPMMVKELLDIAVQSAPMALGAAGKVKQAAKIQAPNIAGQRGSFQRDYVGQLNTDRVGAGERVKQTMVKLNEVVGASVLKEHREVVSHGQTIREGAGWTLDKLIGLDPSGLTLEQGRAAQQAARDAFNKAAQTLNNTMQDVLRTPLGEAALPPVKPGFVRLYRGEAIPGSGVQAPDWARQAAQESGAAEAGGRWFARDPAQADWYVKDADRGRLVYVDVPEAVANESKVSNLPEDSPARRFGRRDPENEHFLPREWADKKQPTEVGLARETAFLDQFATAVVLAGLDERIGREFARGVEARKILSEPGRRTLEERPSEQRPRQRATPGEGMTTAAVLDVAEHLLRDPNVTAEMLAAALSQLTQPQRQHWFRQLWNGFQALRDIVHASWIHSLLSSPLTHTTNIPGASIGILVDVPERFVSEWINAIAHNAPEGAQLGEAARSVYVLGRAYEDMFRLLKQAWQENLPPFEAEARKRAGGPSVFIKGLHDVTQEGKAGMQHITASRYGFDPQTGFGKFIETAGAILNSRYTPGAALMLEDAAMKGIPYRMEIGGQAHRKATLEGLQGTAFEERRAFLDRNPTEEMIAAAQDQAVLITLNKQLGTFGQTFTAIANMVPGGRVMFPFIRWSGNAMKWVNQRTPVLNTISISNWQDYMAGGDLRNRAIARWAVGNAVGAVTAYNVMQGNITPGANTKEQRSLKPYQDCGPYSIRAGDYCIENYIRTLGQVGQMMAVIADYIALEKDIPDQATFDLWVARGEGIAIAAGQMFSNQATMQQLANVLEVIKDPQGKTGRETLGLARSAVPTLVRQVTRVTDDNLVREARSIVDAIKSGLPYYVNDVEIHRNPVTGEGIRYPEGVGPDIASPIFFSKRNKDPVFAEIVANKANMPPLPWYVMGTNPGEEGARLTEPTGAEGVRLTPDQRDFWITQMTQKPGSGGLTLHQFLTEMVASDRYQRQSSGPAGGRAFMLRRAYNAYKTAAFAVLIDPDRGSPTLKDDIIRQLNTRAAARVPVTDPRSPQFQGVGR